MDRTLPMIVVCAALLDADGRVLAQRRPAGKPMAGLWEFPGGKVEPGESLTEALIRELAEELAITVAPEDLVPLAFAEGPGVVLLLHVCRRWTGALSASAADALDWWHPDAIDPAAMPPADRPLVAALRREQKKGDPQAARGKFLGEDA